MPGRALLLMGEAQPAGYLRGRVSHVVIKENKKWRRGRYIRLRFDVTMADTPNPNPLNLSFGKDVGFYTNCSTDKDFVDLFFPEKSL